MKKLIGFLLALACAAGLFGCGTQKAAQDTAAASVSKEDAMMEISKIYVETELKLSDASCVLGNRLAVFSLTGGKLVPSAYEKYPVFARSRVVAFTSCFLGDAGEYLTNCGAMFAEAFWREYSKRPSVPVAIVYARDGVYLVREGENPILLHKMPTADRDPIQELENCRDALVYSVP